MSVPIVFTSKQTLSLNSPDRKIKFSKPSNKLEYSIRHSIDYFSNPEKAPLTIQDYLDGKLYNETDEVNMIIGYDKENDKPIYAKKKDLEKIKDENVRCIKNSNWYQNVISFDNDFINNNITIEELNKEMSKTIIPNFFKSMGFDPDSMTYQLSMHFDTDNLHYHFQFFEKKPAFTPRKSKKKCYRRKANIDEYNGDKLKKNIKMKVDGKNRDLVIEVDNEMKKIKDQFKNKEHNFLLEHCREFRLDAKIYELGKLLNDYKKEHHLPKKNTVKFGSIKDKNIQKLTREIADDLFKNDIINKKDFDNAVDKLNNYFEDLNTSLNIKGEVDKRQTEKREEELNNFIMNQILNNSLYEYNQQNYQNYSKKKRARGFIHEIAYQNYKNARIKTKEAVMQYYIDKKNEYYEQHQKYSGFDSSSVCSNIKSFEFSLKRMTSKQSMEVKKLRERANINWYDKTRY